MDSNTIKINKYFDNNLLSFKSSSETVSDLPFMLGEFSLPKKKQDSFKQKLEKIRKILNGITGDSGTNTISPTDRSRIENQISMLQLMSENNNNETSNIKNIVN